MWIELQFTEEVDVDTTDNVVCLIASTLETTGARRVVDVMSLQVGVPIGASCRVAWHVT